MRVVGGSWRGRRIEAPEGKAVRPTSDRAREAIFNILEHGRHAKGGGSPVPGARVLDAFAGSGALCIVELDRDEAFAAPEGFDLLDDRHYGKARVVILSREG
jgi:16S rRNA (guanine966-N2)-methyltransferase